MRWTGKKSCGKKDEEDEEALTQGIIFVWMLL